jgi:hypothetical protein
MRKEGKITLNTGFSRCPKELVEQLKTFMENSGIYLEKKNSA